MLLNDPIGDMLTRFRNAQHARKESCTFPWSRIKEEICTLMKREGYLGEITVSGDKPHLEITVAFIPDKKVTVERRSTPGKRRFIGADQIKPILHGYGLSIISTSQGLLTDTEARAKHVGGEVLCLVS